MYDFEYINESIKMEQELFEMNCIVEHSIIINEGVVSTIVDAIKRFFGWLADKFNDFIDWVKGLFGGSSDVSKTEKEVEKSIINDGSEEDIVQMEYKLYSKPIACLTVFIEEYMEDELNDLSKMVQNIIGKMNECKSNKYKYNDVELITDEKLNNTRTIISNKLLKELNDIFKLDDSNSINTLQDYLNKLITSFKIINFNDRKMDILETIKKNNELIPDHKQSLKQFKNYINKVSSSKDSLQKIVKSFEDESKNQGVPNVIVNGYKTVLAAIQESYISFRQICAAYVQLILQQKHENNNILNKLK